MAVLLMIYNDQNFHLLLQLQINDEIDNDDAELIDAVLGATYDFNVSVFDGVTDATYKPLTVKL